jgi:hypothetical protein
MWAYPDPSPSDPCPGVAEHLAADRQPGRCPPSPKPRFSRVLGILISETAIPEWPGAEINVATKVGRSLRRTKDF